MHRSASVEDNLVMRLQRQLPLFAHGRPPLLAFLKPLIGNARITPRLKVTAVFCSDRAHSIICNFVLDDELEQRRVFVAPLEQLAFDRRYPIAREIAMRNRRRLGQTDK